MRLVTQNDVFRECARYDVRHRNRARAKVQIIVLEPQDPTVGERIIHSGADHPSGSVSPAALIEHGRDLGSLEETQMCERSAAFQIKQCRVERVAEAGCCGA
jgi:hypothetical protein